MNLLRGLGRGGGEAVQVLGNDIHGNNALKDILLWIGPYQLTSNSARIQITVSNKTEDRVF